MKKLASVEFEIDGIKCYLKNKIAVLHLTCSAFDTIVNFESDTIILDWMDLIEESKEINGILVVNEKDCMSEKEYVKFLSYVSGLTIDPDHPQAITKFEKTQVRAVEINMLMNFIKRVSNFKKIFISGLNGQIVTPLFGMALAADFRFANSSTRLNLSHIKYSLHPSGALPFFLPRYIGITRATEYLLQGGEINADEALSLGLINKILPEENYIENCIVEAEKLCNLSQNYIKITKTLLNSYSKELKNYFELESNFLLS